MGQGGDVPCVGGGRKVGEAEDFRHRVVTWPHTHTHTHTGTGIQGMRGAAAWLVVILVVGGGL